MSVVLTTCAALALFQNRRLSRLDTSTSCPPVQLVAFNIERSDLGHTASTENAFSGIALTVLRW